MNAHCINLEMQAGMTKSFNNLVLNYSDTLSLDGILLPGVEERLTALAMSIRITVFTADTFGKAERQLAGLPVQVRIVSNGYEKLGYMRQLVPESVIAIGNGRNDVHMMAVAGLRIAVVGPAGAAIELLKVTEIVVTDIRHALDLIANPLRVKATLCD